jgi:uncharacterized UPF0160 family protein
LLPTYQRSPVIRTRDPSVLAICHTVVDVGGEYSPAKHRYDHHQRTFNTTFPEHQTKLSSAGLVYLHFGKLVIAHQTKLPEDNPEVGLLWEKLYADFVEALDAHDNGISVYDPEATKGLTKRYVDSGVTLGSLVKDLNHDWTDDEEGPTATDMSLSSPDPTQQREDARFSKATALMGTTFLRKLNYLYREWLPARSYVREIYAGRKQHGTGGRVMVFARAVPWKDHLYAVEAEHPEDEPVLYVLFPESSEEGCPWRIQAVPESRDSFESRKKLPEPWRGYRDESLDEIAGIQGCIFVHAGGFIGGNKTLDGVMKMALEALK